MTPLPTVSTVDPSTFVANAERLGLVPRAHFSRPFTDLFFSFTSYGSYSPTSSFHFV